MGKTASVHQNCYALNTFRDNDIYVQAGQILFDPYTTMAELWENYHYMKHYDWIISKGVFTEMFAATGTPFQNKISKNNMIVSENAKLGNHAYMLQDVQARVVYDALWYHSHEPEILMLLLERGAKLSKESYLYKIEKFS